MVRPDNRAAGYWIEGGRDATWSFLRVFVGKGAAEQVLVYNFGAELVCVNLVGSIEILLAQLSDPGIGRIE